MSGAIIYTPSTGADWATAWEQVEYTRKGKLGISLTNYTNGSLPAIASGSWAEVAGSIYKWTTEEAISGSPTDAYHNYISLVPSGSGDTAIVTATWTTTAPSWSDAYQGWYSGTSRYIGHCFYTGSEYLEKSVIADGPQRALQLWPWKYERTVKKTRLLEEDFLNDIGGGNWALQWTAVSTGTFTTITSGANGSGIGRIANGGTNDCGGAIHTDLLAVNINGWEVAEFSFSLPTVTNLQVRMGFMNAISLIIPTKAIILTMTDSTLSGYVRDLLATSTSSTYTVSTSTIYRAFIIVNVDMTRIDFFLYSAAGSLLWHDYVTTNIPTNEDLAFVVEGTNGTSGAANVIDLDYMAFWMERELAR
jgi:hypothetical protein